MKVKEVEKNHRTFLIENPHGDKWELVTSSNGVIIKRKYDDSEGVEDFTHEQALLWILDGITIDCIEEERSNK